LLGALLLTITSVFGQTALNYPFEVEKRGDGDQSIIFIPGFACSSKVWSETIAVYEKNYVCYALTMAGFADAAPQSNPTFEDWKTGIADFIKNKKIEKPIIIGHSMGGGLAMAIAADYPDLIEKIVVVDALPCLVALTNPNFEQKENNDCSAIINQMTAFSEEQFYQMQKMSMFQLVQNKEMIDTIVSWSVQSDRMTFAQMYCDFSNTDLRDKIENINCPTLVLLESYFKNFKPAIEGQYKKLKSANLEYANKGLHFIMYDDKEWYFEKVATFLNN
jgi:pimeloyl-ACP methyl ester carboxylesterase